MNDLRLMAEIITLYSVVWILFHFGAGYVAHHLPARLLVALPFVSRSYARERAGKAYRWLGIHTWKDRIPEAGAFYRGGFSKRHLQGHDLAYLERFALETTRAEFSHWLTWGLSLTFFAWTPWPVGVMMVLYGAASNVPFILVQRYNRARLCQIIQASARRTHGNRTPLPLHAVAHQREVQ
jgi:glycosyl-4,4'-diaponeurosporenoate acyltransferase